ncbi:MAG: C39 family peptidase [Lachnospiraceae bacterium]|nr:C39 family peptidase [Lachnospiraceae bacterium]
MMKKMLVWTLCAAMLLAVAGCGESRPRVEKVEIAELAEAENEEQENSEKASAEEEENALSADTESEDDAAETDNTEAAETDTADTVETGDSASGSDKTEADDSITAETTADENTAAAEGTDTATQSASASTTVVLSDDTVFDAEYYANTYADVKASCGTDFDALLNHYLTYGKKEGRQPSAEGTAANNAASATGTADAASTTGAATTTTTSASDSGHQISGFSIIYQNPELPTGCESVAATMLINYYGFSADKVDLADNYLPKASATFYYDANGNKIGPDMENYFVGDPHSSGYICGVSAILTEVNGYLSAQGSSLRAVDKTGISFDDLYAYIDNDTPVMVWVTIYMANRRSTTGWYTEDGRWMEYATNDHGAVLIGYTDTTVTIADPISGKVEYSRSQFESVFASRSNKAVIIQ